MDRRKIDLPDCQLEVSGDPAEGLCSGNNPQRRQCALPWDPSTVGLVCHVQCWAKPPRFCLEQLTSCSDFLCIKCCGCCWGVEGCCRGS
jgi:hypothetical protein